MEVHIYIYIHIFLSHLCLYFLFPKSGLILIRGSTQSHSRRHLCQGVNLFTPLCSEWWWQGWYGANVMMVLMKVMALDTCDACELSYVQIGKNMTMKIFFLVTQRNGLNSIALFLTITIMKTRGPWRWRQWRR